MIVLKGILNESREYYQKIAKEIKNKIASFPKGSIKKRKINGKNYYYLQYREMNQIKHKYLGKNYPVNKAEEIAAVKKKNKQLKKEQKKVKEALKVLGKRAYLK
ncbi:MAG: hypothetical protein A2297_01620 [Elusimicrobia bacterium RIFOXYB2_FULL_48_7]|nr:MAG: hypothetical protein A2297_01620 [Elusimicrobia bacterium RIFOXYB2_FULL_48_7]